MKQFFVTVAGVFVGLLLFFVGAPVVILSLLASAAAPAATPSGAVLTLDLRGGLTDQEPLSPFAGFSGGGLSVMRIAHTLDAAAKDDRVKGLLVRLPEGGMEPAAAEELRDGILRLKAAKKVVYAHSQGLHASGVATATYMLGAAADEFWMQPGAPFEASGIANEDVFFKRAFDRFGVQAQFEQREEFKNAVNPYLFSDYTPAHKASQLQWLGAVYAGTLANAAADRKVQPQLLRTSLEAGPYDAAQAASNGLIDRVGQPYEAELALKKKVAGSKVIEFGDYAAEVEDLNGDDGVIAVISAEGAIMTGQAGGGVSPIGGDTVFSDQVAQAFYHAAEDKSIKAVIFRISSPGGSDTAAEQISAAMQAVKAAGKPIVVSMGTYAASGGYWVSAGADRIIAHPTTLTGSIGVYGGKFAVGEAAARYGVDLRQTVVGGPYAGANGMGEPFTPAQRALYAAQVDRVYARFIDHVARGRRMQPEHVRELAKGRVWTGAEAKQLGLVDQLGGFAEAVQAAKALAKIEGEPQLRYLPAPMSVFDALEQAMGVSASNVRTLAAAGWLLGDPRAKAAIDQIAETRLRARGANTLAPRPF